MRSAYLLALCLIGIGKAAAAAEPPVPPWAQRLSRAEDLSAHLVTFGPGDNIYQYFGHVGIEIRDERRRAAVLYDFGLFTFDSAMVPKFLMGRLWFWSGGRNPTFAVGRYVAEDSDVHTTALALSPAQTLDLAERLVDAVRPENRTYLYHHYTNNCATRLLDLLDAVLDGRLKPQLQAPDPLTLRDHTRRYTHAHPVVEWLMMFAMNDEVDRPIRRLQATFLPQELAKAVGEIEYVDADGARVPLATRSWFVHRSRTRPAVPERPPVRWPWTLSLGLVVGSGLMFAGHRAGSHPSRAHRRWFGAAHALAGLALGGPGMLVALMATLTDHTVTYGNENLLFANPLTLFAGFVGIGFLVTDPRRERLLAGGWLLLAFMNVLGVAIKVLPGVSQENTMVWTLTLPVTLAAAWSAHRAARR